ncbi:MAG: IS66 family transposase [Planctomycetota bacterium]|nr:IS66 family transposase [Planctomycetota bacterium]
MNCPITTELVVAYHQCKRKAFLILQGETSGIKHEYEEILTTRTKANCSTHLVSLDNSALTTDLYQASMDSKISGGQISHENFEAVCDGLVQRKRRSPKKHLPYEPYIVVGTYSISMEQKVRLAFAGYVVGEMLRYRPATGIIIPFNRKPHQVRLASFYPTIEAILNALRPLVSAETLKVLPPTLNDHCQTCQFCQRCLEEADKEDHLSLLERMTPALIQKYQKRGIFTVKQLSYVFKPRRRRKQVSKATATFNVELQALALRTGKIYVHDSPSIPKPPVEIYLDVEGIPDQGFDYLIGVVIKENEVLTEHSFWADSPKNEKDIFEQFITLTASLGNAPIYHYGSYETRALRRITKKYGLKLDPVGRRFVNINSFIFGKVYFPSRSNSLKALGALVGAKWASPNPSGLQSLVWRYRWEDTHREEMKQALLAYNLSDCHAVRLLTAELREIGKASDARDDIDFADFPKQNSTDRGAEIHQAFEGILASAHAVYRQHRIRIRQGDKSSKTTGGKVGAPRGHPGYFRITPAKAGRVVRVRRRMKCPQRSHKGESLQPTGQLTEHTIIDLVFTKNGCRRAITKYLGEKTYCQRCHSDYLPPAISRFGRRLFGHAFQAWALYQRIVLRLPYTAITRTIKDLFSEQVTKATIVNFIRNVSDHYESTENLLLARILASPFIHVDETKISIQGIQNYVWVLTNGMHVVFRLTETRETTLIQKILSAYKGVLVSDFYGGYDAVACRQQKCLSHLIRDLNDDLWKNPFNSELESFVAAVRDVLVPIFDDVGKYGLKARNLRKHKRVVKRFYAHCIDRHIYECEIVAKYQKRFIRYRDSLFLFIEEDEIPWNNNAAERAIRHLAVQRKISGSFYRELTSKYLRLLGIGQTCRFQEKSFLRFLTSGKKDVDQYRERKHQSASEQSIKSEKS